VHLGNTIVSQLDDTKEILIKRNELCGKINNVRHVLLLVLRTGCKNQTCAVIVLASTV